MARGSQEDLSVVITAHNEGDEVWQTVESIRQSTCLGLKIYLVDDGSTDGCCEGLAEQGIDVIRHESRVGVARSRAEAISRTAGATIAILDAHQRLEPGCLDQCARLALEKQAIVSPDIRGFDDDRTLHGAYFVFDRRRQLFAAEWKTLPPKVSVARNSSLRAPLYVIPRDLYSKVQWSRALSGWGGSEAAISLKAFFAGVNLLHICGPVSRHKFKQHFHYEVGWPEIWKNHAIIARICFEERNWYEYWLPEVFASRLSDDAQADLESEEIRNEHDSFQELKLRRDREFWTRLIYSDVPPAVQ